MRLLAAGSSKPPVELLKDAGVDFVGGSPVLDALALVRADVVYAREVVRRRKK
jgi:oligoendopeptidase F